MLQRCLNQQQWYLILKLNKSFQNWSYRTESNSFDCNYFKTRCVSNNFIRLCVEMHWNLSIVTFIILNGSAFFVTMAPTEEIIGHPIGAWSKEVINLINIMLGQVSMTTKNRMILHTTLVAVNLSIYLTNNLSDLISQRISNYVTYIVLINCSLITSYSKQPCSSNYVARILVNLLMLT